ncbi:hypothetical protein C0J52_13046 [Blattella germanica]|nr:hypothetical protein C0J52_13046 [Blattella germanica]
MKSGDLWCTYKGGGGLKAVFHIGGFVNRHNCHYWASANPHECVEKANGLPKVTAWCHIMSSQVVGLFFLRNTMNGKRDMEMLQEGVWPVISQWNNPQLHFMQDGAPVHFANDVREWLHDHFQVVGLADAVHMNGLLTALI